MNRFLLIALLFIFFACDQNRIFEDNYVLDEEYWHVDSIARFTFDITEIDASYDIFLNVRNTSAYPYYNLYVKFNLLDSAENEMASDLIDLELFDPKTGAPNGSGLGDVFNHQFRILDNYEFSSYGKFTVEYQQFMRIDSLPRVQMIGARVAKSAP